MFRGLSLLVILGGLAAFVACDDTADGVSPTSTLASLPPNRKKVTPSAGGSASAEGPVAPAPSSADPASSPPAQEPMQTPRACGMNATTAIALPKLAVSVPVTEVPDVRYSLGNEVTDSDGGARVMGARLSGTVASVGRNRLRKSVLKDAPAASDLDAFDLGTTTVDHQHNDWAVAASHRDGAYLSYGGSAAFEGVQHTFYPTGRPAAFTGTHYVASISAMRTGAFNVFLRVKDECTLHAIEDVLGKKATVAGILRETTRRWALEAVLVRDQAWFEVAFDFSTLTRADAITAQTCATDRLDACAALLDAFEGALDDLHGAPPSAPTDYRLASNTGWAHGQWVVGTLPDP